MTARAPLALGAQLPGRRAFVTGGGSGLGLALATHLARDGWSLGLLDREPARLDAAVRELAAAGARDVHAYVADVTDEAAFTRAIDDYAARAGGLDLMVNNAGVAAAGAVDVAPIDDWRWLVEINVIGVAIGCRAAIPHLKRAGAGHVLNVASAASFACAATLGAYNASKAAVVAITETLVQEFAGTGLRATVAMPGFFRTNLLEGARVSGNAGVIARKLMERSTTSAEQVAREILDACARGRVHVVLPAPYPLLWRFKRLAPARFLRWLASKRKRP